MLHNIFDRLYSKLKRRYGFHSVLRFAVRELNSVLTPIYFKLCKRGRASFLPRRGEEKIIVFLTTFPARIKNIWMVIECLLRQSTLPDKIILYLSREQFPGELNDIPINLKKYCGTGILNLKFVSEDLRSHKKYFYALQEYPTDLIITLDDDIFYASNIISDLMGLHDEFPGSICSLRAYEVTKVRGKIDSYPKWKKVEGFRSPTLNLFHTSGGGTLYKKEFFPNDVFDDEVFMKYCRYADDVWLNLMAQKKSTKTVKGTYFSNLLPIKSNSFKLSDNNVANNGNDQQIKEVITYYGMDESKLFN